ncbi:MAG: mechanosensitive ion channel family protein [Haloarculaceae archaeon]
MAWSFVDAGRVVLQATTRQGGNLSQAGANVSKSAANVTSGEIPTFGVLPQPVADLLATILVLILAWGATRLLVQLFGRRIAQRFRRPSVTRMVIRSLRAGVYVLALLFILQIYGMELGDIALSVTVFTAVVGVVLAPIVGSIISGFFLLADQPYEIGDMIEISDAEQRGFVEDITLRYTKMFTLDNTFLVVPNGEMRTRDVVNYSAEDPRTRQTLDVLVTYEGDLAEARDIVEKAAREVDVVIEGGPDIRVGSARYPAAPTCYIDEFADHGVNLRLRYWVEEPYRLLAARSQVQSNVWDRLEAADVEIAYPHQHHVFDETSGRVGVSVDGQSVGAPSHDPAAETSGEPDRDGRDPSRTDSGED